MNGPAFLVHHRGDHVGVAVADLSPGHVRGETLDDQTAIEIDLVEPIPLGHKLALKDLSADSELIEYGLCIGIVSADIAQGQHVHVHNVRSARWQNSIA